MTTYNVMEQPFWCYALRLQKQVYRTEKDRGSEVGLEPIAFGFLVHCSTISTYQNTGKLSSWSNLDPKSLMCVLDMDSLMYCDALFIPQAKLLEQKTKNIKDLVRSMFNFFYSMLNLQDATTAYNGAVPQKSCSKQLFFFCWPRVDKWYALVWYHVCSIAWLKITKLCPGLSYFPYFFGHFESLAFF